MSTKKISAASPLSAEEALQAIRARIQGEWDHPVLLKVGPLRASVEDDVLRIVETAMTGQAPSTASAELHSGALAEVLREVYDTLEQTDALGDAHPNGGTVGASILGALSGYAEARLRALGYEMDIDPGAIPGEGHLLMTLDGEDVDPDTVSDEVRELAREWSDLADRLEELEPEGYDIGGMSPKP